MILSLFSGYGGLDLAVEAATGLSVAAVADIDKGARMILDHRYPEVPNLGDVSKVDFTAWRGLATVLTGGYPCQPFSGAGARKGTNDPRHLFPHVARAIGEMGPSLVVLENVRGHLSLGFDTVLGTLSDLGYDARWILARASDVGAPHQRARLFIVAAPHADDTGRGEQRWALTAPPQQPALEYPRDAAPHARVQRHGGGQDTPGVGRVAGQDESGTRQRQRTRTLTGTGGDPARFGRYAPAVARWEALTRPAPDPARDGRLSPAFVEWMMGLPEGWVTDVPGLTDNQAKHALGNGVVPQQALYALHALGVAA